MLMSVILLSAVGPSAPAPADLVLLNGNVVTVDPQQPRASAVAIGGSTILATGRDQQIHHGFALIGRQFCDGDGVDRTQTLPRLDRIKPGTELLRWRKGRVRRCMLLHLGRSSKADVKTKDCKHGNCTQQKVNSA